MPIISIEVDEQTARSFATATPENQRKLGLLLRLRLRELVDAPSRPLGTVMDEISAYAEAQGLTPEKLDALLHDDCLAGGVRHQRGD